MKRVLGAAALGGGLLALSAGAAGAQEVSADTSARLGRPTSAEARVCADGRVLSGLLGSCSGSGTSADVQAGGGDGATGEVRAQVPGTAEADVSIGTRPSGPAAGASGQAATSRPSSLTADADTSVQTSPSAQADASARLTRPLLDLDATASLAGVGLLGSSPFTLVGDPATDNLLPTGELTLDGLTGQAPAGIGVLDSGPIASGNQVGVDAGDVSPSAPVTVCGNGVGVLGDASASCTPAAPSGSSSGSTGSGSTGAPAGSGSASSDSLLANLTSGNQVDAGIGDISPSAPVTVCGNGVGVLGDASAGCGAAPSGGSGTGSAGGGSGATQADGIPSGNQVDANVGDISPSVPVTVCGNSAGVLGDASAACGTGQQAGGGSTGSTGSGSTGASAGTGSGSLPGDIASGNQVDAGIGSISPSVPMTVCGNSVGALGDASASCGTTAPSTSSGGASAGASGSTDVDGTLAGNQAQVTVGDVAASVPATVCGNSVGLLGDASSSCGTTTSTTPGSGTGTDTGPGTGTTAEIDLSIGTAGGSTGTPTDTDTGAGIGVDIGAGTGTDTSTGGIIAPPPGTTSPGGTDGGDGPGFSTGTSGVPGTQGLSSGAGGADGSGASVTTFAPLRPSVAGTGSGALPFTGAAGDLLALVAFALLVAGALVVRATRPAAAPEGGDDR